MFCNADFINNGKWISLFWRLLFEKIRGSEAPWFTVVLAVDFFNAEAKEITEIKKKY